MLAQADGNSYTEELPATEQPDCWLHTHKPGYQNQNSTPFYVDFIPMGAAT
jgi:hypothetical protein